MADDIRCGCGYTIIKQVENAVSGCCAVAWVREDREAGIYVRHHPSSRVDVVDADSDKLCTFRANGIVGLFQLHELVAADSSEVTPVEHEHDAIMPLEGI